MIVPRRSDSLATYRGQTVFIVGASCSFGHELLQLLLNHSYRVIATKHATRLPVSHPSLHWIPLDLRDPQHVRRIDEELHSLCDEIDIVIMLAGILPGHSLSEYEDDEIDKVMAINFAGQAKLIKSLGHRLANPSHILMMSSIAADHGSYDPIYAASKGAVVAFVKSLARWHAPKTRVNAIAPSLIEGSTMSNLMSQERRQSHRADNPMRALLKRKDLARLIIDLLQPHWAHLNGSVIRPNGGMYV